MVDAKELAYTLVFVSSQDDATIESSKIFSRDFLYGKGWISEQFCRYPQEIIIRLEEISTLNQISLLTHHVYTPQNVDLFVGVPRNGRNSNPHWTEAHFVGMGAAEFQDNSGTDGTQSERKTIYTNAIGFFIKFVFGKNWETSWNRTGQVGLLGVKIFGVSHGSGRVVRLDPHGDGGYVLGDGSDSDTYYADDILHRDRQKRLTKKKNKTDDKQRAEPHPVLEIEGRKFRPPSFVDHKEYDDLNQLLEEKKKHAVYKRSYADAKEIKVIQEDLMEQKRQIQQNHAELLRALEAEDFEQAKQLQATYDRDRFNCTKRYRHLPRFLNEKEVDRCALDVTNRVLNILQKYHYVDNFGRRERAQQEGYADPTKLDGQVEGNVAGRHYHFNPRRYGDPLKPTSSLWDNVSTVDGNGGVSATPWAGGAGNQLLPGPGQSRATSRNNTANSLRPGSNVSGRPNTAERELRPASGFPDEQTVQNILEMHKKEDPRTDAEITRVMEDMQKKNRTDLDWRLQEVMRHHGIPWSHRVDNRETDVFGKNVRVPKSRGTDNSIYNFTPATPLPGGRNLTTADTTVGTAQGTVTPAINQPDTRSLDSKTSGDWLGLKD